MPHLFPSLIDGPAHVVVIAGTGLSQGKAPTVAGLVDRLTVLAAGFGVSVALDPNHDDYFYVLAEALFAHWVTFEGLTDHESRLRLAERLGMLDETVWFGDVGVPLARNTPRHRAIARFVIEDRFRAIVCLNWDALLEAALDSAGLRNGGSCQRPWRVTGYAGVVDACDKPMLADPRVFPVVKPHGCVRKLAAARRVFNVTGVVPPVTLRVTKTELTTPPVDRINLIDAHVPTYVSECPLLTLGWKASEGYLRSAIVGAVREGARTACDAFTVVNRSWYPNPRKVGTFHQELAVGYGKTESDCYISASDVGPLTLDSLFQWLHARFALRCLTAAVSVPYDIRLGAIFAGLEDPLTFSPVIVWADHWLPAWVRLCWRMGVMQGNDPGTGRPVLPSDIPLVPRDLHVPMAGMTQTRRDLAAAGRLLCEVKGVLAQFNFEIVPGAFWDVSARTFVVPVPGWRGPGSGGSLSGFKGLVDALRVHLSYGVRLRLLPLCTDGTAPDPVLCREIEAQVQSLLPLSGLSTSGRSLLITLDELKGVPHAPTP